MANQKGLFNISGALGGDLSGVGKGIAVASSFIGLFLVAAMIMLGESLRGVMEGLGNLFSGIGYIGWKLGDSLNGLWASFRWIGEGLSALGKGLAVFGNALGSAKGAGSWVWENTLGRFF